ncbi:major facilitator superfamily domain-containing protein [Lasiosphaeris hirsuta]|uniref:Major facilitator superfamily domain-containing protein n=1 Tax=Lasiosphaeris hirsuta TaxID=260670 RepID=A0AA40AYX1_9PEZI|nr:major facilitator superfamily domain-containing protein [Lasiosphaeris hirsuta]
MSGSLVAYVTSDFYAHGLTATTGIMSGLIGGLSKLALAKILDIWGRPQGFAIVLVFLTIGLIMMAACNGVETYCAAQVFYWVGYNGISYTISIFIADTSALKNRGLMLAFASSPYIITVWVGGPLAQAFLDGPGWRWAYGTFAIITPVVCMPLLALFWVNYRRADAAGLLPRREVVKRTSWQSVVHYFHEFDVVGLFLITAGLALFLLPFSIYHHQAEQWKSPLIIAFIVVGGVLIIGFAFWEKYFARVTFIPYELLMDRTVLGACILAATLFVSFYIWNSYFFSFLQVVTGLSVTEATYLTNTYSIGSCFWSIVVGILIRRTGRFKWIALYFGVPITILGVGLMIAFRQPGVNVGYIVMCQIFIAFGGGTLVICEQIAVMAATSHQYIAVVLAIEGMFASVGGAIGSTIAAAIWNGVFPERLAEFLPLESQGNFTEIYTQLPVQISYPPGSPTRDAINAAYGDAQKWMIVASTVIQIISIISVLVWRDIKVKDFKQVKGLVV